MVPTLSLARRCRLERFIPQCHVCHRCWRCHARLCRLFAHALVSTQLSVLACATAATCRLKVYVNGLSYRVQCRYVQCGPAGVPTHATNWRSSFLPAAPPAYRRKVRSYMYARTPRNAPAADHRVHASKGIRLYS